MKWNHIIFYTNDYKVKYKPKVEDYFRLLINKNKFRNRYFYLYEITKSFPTNIFFAYEGEYKLKFPKLPDFFECYKIVKNSSDSNNGECFLTVLHQICKSNLDCSLRKQQKDRPKGILHMNHIIHCMMNVYTGSRKEELNEYLEQVKFFGISNFQ